MERNGTRWENAQKWSEDFYILERTTPCRENRQGAFLGFGGLGGFVFFDQFQYKLFDGREVFLWYAGKSA